MAYNRISQVAPVGQMQGLPIKIRSRLNEDFVVWSFVLRQGIAGREYAIVQAYEMNSDGEVDTSKPFWFTCGAVNLVEGLRKAEPYLPVVVRVSEITTRAGRKVLTIQ